MEASTPKEFLDQAFPEKKSSNVIAKFEPTGPSDRLVILGTHLNHGG